MRPTTIVLLSMLIFLPGCTSFSDAPGQVRSSIDEFGIYYTDRTDGEVWTSQNSTNPEVIEFVELVLLEETEIVPLRKGVTFGVGFTINNCSDGNFSYDLTIRHPKITKPNGEVSYGYTGRRDLKCKDGRTSAIRAYTFDEDYEMVPGEWAFVFSHSGSRLFEQSFQVSRQSS